MPVGAKTARGFPIGEVKFVIVMRLKLLCEAMSAEFHSNAQDWGSWSLRPNRHGERTQVF